MNTYTGWETKREPGGVGKKTKSSSSIMENQEISETEKSRNQHTRMLLRMTGFRTHYLQIWCLDILNILSWRNLSNGRCKKDSLTSSTLKQVLRSSCNKCSPYTWRKGTSLHVKMEGQRQKSKGTGPVKFPQFTTLSSYSSMTPYSFKPSIKCSGLTTSSGLHFLMKVPMSHKTYIK